jgi:cobalt-zinc-cadmium resistance protein CzcA
LEKTTAEVQLENLSVQLKTLKNEIELAKIQLQLLLNSATRYEPFIEQIIAEENLSTETKSNNSFPAVQYAAQEIEKAKALTQLERSKLLPNLSIGYFNQSFNDFNNKRYSSVEVGVGIPLFYGAQKAQIKAQQQRIIIAENELIYKKAQWQTDYETVLQNYSMQKEIVESYKNKQLRMAEQMTQAAQKQYDNGEINFLDWVMLNNQATQIKSDYFDAVMLLNQTIINIQFLNSK